ncbi:MAG: outer membrane protein assembly factor BamD [Rickettsiales bacterium]|nr:outer membrane protein assembly factor BamD [Rickettsiales bacterium]
MKNFLNKFILRKRRNCRGIDPCKGQNLLVRSARLCRVSLVLVILLVASCGDKKITPETGDRHKDAKLLYSEANNALKEEDYKKAATLFSRITYEFPYYALANKAHIMEIYSNYLLKDYDSVIFSVENYVKTHPVSSYIPYAYYMKALAYYSQIALPQRDQSMTKKAKEAFLEVISRFPKSEYAQDAKTKLALVDDHLAAHEMVIGRYYLNKDEVSSAIARFKNVVSKYSTTSQVEEALFRLVEAYLFLGIKKEAQKYAAVLGHNYPKSKWYKYSYELLKDTSKKKF